MPNLDQYLKIDRCPYCSIDNPNLETVTNAFLTKSDNDQNQRIWVTYKCKRCGGVIIASSNQQGGVVFEMYPKSDSLDTNIPQKVKAYLQQAIDSVFAPSGSVMLCASSVDAMLKEKGYSTGSLYKRITSATVDGLLTKDMEIWAHEVRLDANNERHADANAELPNIQDAKQAIEFTKTLADLLFVLPNRVKRGIEATKQNSA